MKKEFRVIVDHQRNGEDIIRGELTVHQEEEVLQQEVVMTESL